MKIARLSLTFLVAPLVLVAAGCGGSSSSGGVPSDAVALVAGIPITQSEFDAMLEANKAQMKAQSATIPKAGTPEYTALRTRILDFLVQRTEFESKAKSDLGIEVSNDQVDKRLKQIKKQYFAGSQKRYEAQIKKQGLTDEQVRADVKSQLLSEAIFKKVTADVKVSDAQVAAYYKSHLTNYRQPAKRQVRHILVKTKAEADNIERQLAAGADFAKLAKKYSTDKTTKPLGGTLPGGVTKGTTVPPFDKVAFSIKTKKISDPVHTQYGWHIIEALSNITPAKTPPLKEEKAAITQTLLQQKKNDVMTKWVDGVKKQYASKVKYAPGFGLTTTGGTTSTG